MPKEYEHAPLICAIITAIALIGIIVGGYFKLPLVVLFLMLPAVVYEIYRTEGVSTKFASVGMLLILIAEAVLIIGNININLSNIAGGKAEISRYRIPLGDVKMAGPIIIAILSGILMRRTAGKYTIWLAVVILISSIGLLYALNPDILHQLFRSGVVEEGIRRMR
jgi:hypothetical protein